MQDRILNLVHKNAVWHLVLAKRMELGEQRAFAKRECYLTGASVKMR